MEVKGRGMAAWAATVFSLSYVVGQLAEWMGWLGSVGGPHAPSTPLGLAVLLTPSLLLGPAFLLTMVALHEAAPEEKRVWSLGALAFAAVYVTMIGFGRSEGEQSA